jgi:Ca-activated chloride channel family protein
VSALYEFHLLRPGWLWAALPVTFLLWRLARARSETGWRRLIAPHLLNELMIRVGEASSRIKPGFLLGTFWIFALLALSGPTWERESSPLGEEESAIVLVLHLGPSMDARDVQPSRLERAIHKIHDLLALRRGAPTALIVYAGSAHGVLPLTTDQALVEQMAGELSTDIMPLEGEAVVEAVALAGAMLASHDGDGHVLLITDVIPPETIPALAGTGVRADLLAMAAPPDAPVPLLGPAAPALDRATFSSAARALQGRLVEVTVDSSDVETLADRLARRVGGRVDSGDPRWRDGGYWLLFPTAAVWALGFRRGFVVRWRES